MPAALVGDPGRLRQVLINLLSNAVSSLETGGRQPAAEVRNQPTRRCRTQVHRFDTGIGAPEAARQARPFTPFSQVDASMTRRASAALARAGICRQIVDDGRRKLALRPRQNNLRSSTFWFTARFAASSGGSDAANAIADAG